MEELLVEKNGQEIELTCGTVCLSGKIVQVKNGVLHLEDERDLYFIAVEYITLFKDVSDENKHQVGFGLMHSKSEI